MGSTVASETRTKELRELCTALVASLPETLGSLIGRELVVHAVGVELQTRAELLGSLPRNHAIVRGALDKDFAGRTLSTLFEVQDASAMSGLLMMAPAEIIDERRAKGVIEAEDAEAFGELANVLCSGFANVLRERLANIDCRLQDHGIVGPGADPRNMLPEGDLATFAFRVRIADYPESIGRIVCDRATAESWNKGPLVVGAPEAQGTATAAKPVDTAPAKDDDPPDDSPAVPVRGILNAYVATADCFLVLRRSCRRVGLELRRHGRAEIPNPAAHRNEIVLIDVPAGEEKRIDWCRRIKDFCNTTKVVLLLQMPSRARVTMAFKTQADAILGLPVEESLLSAKLAALLGG
jgi:hypothetical protein